MSFYTSVGCDVFLFNYRGYGRSGGSASPGTINKDVQEVVEYLREQVGVTRLAVHGESIGGVAAASVARHSQVRREDTKHTFRFSGSRKRLVYTCYMHDSRIQQRLPLPPLPIPMWPSVWPSLSWSAFSLLFCGVSRPVHHDLQSYV